MRAANECVTVWNRYRDDESRQDRWVGHVVHGCAWHFLDDRINILIGFERNVAVEYKSPHVWRDLDDEGKTKFFTVREGDVLARGERIEKTSAFGTHDTSPPLWRHPLSKGDLGMLDVDGEQMTVSDLRELLGRDMCVVTQVADNTLDERHGRHLNVAGR